MPQTMLARQPIFDCKDRVHAYELLYRGPRSGVNGSTMTASVLNKALNNLGLHSVADDKLIFVNFSRALLLSDLPGLLPPDKTVLEVLEDVPADAEVIDALRHWKELGYTIALDDMISINGAHRALVPLADIIKVDILDVQDDLAELVAGLRRHPVSILAEKVETQEQYRQCKSLGFDFFQGYFFCKPSLMLNQHHLDTHKTQLMHILSQTFDADSPKELEHDIAHNMSLSYKLLCYINSAHIGLRSEIDSIGHALILLGMNKLRVWFTMLLMSSISGNKPDALIILSFCRGRFLELLAEHRQEKQQGNDYFILGMFSLIEAMLDQSVEQALESISLPTLVREGLLNEASTASQRLGLLRAIENGEWDELEERCRSDGLDEDAVSSIYAESIRWADERFAFLKSM
ncbi:MAG: EAL domain-containing protein [Mariprofundaceae bacterium]|nr:EAL domain-containing protein [Mariprofundaceae bacterium]